MPLNSQTMSTTHSHLPFLLLLLLLLLLILPFSTATSSALIGVNYGLLGDNLLPPSKVSPLLHSINVGRIKLYNADPTILRSFSNTGIELIVALPDRCIPKICDPNESLAWIRSNIQPFIPSTKIVSITVGNEVLTGNNTSLYQSLLPAMRSLHSSLVSLNLDRQISVTTPHSVAILASSYPPSNGSFRPNLIPILCPIFDFLSQTNSPLLINAYPYFAYKSDPGNISLDYVLFEPNAGVLDPKTGFRYENMLHAQVDAMYAAIAAVRGPRSLEVRVSETGWPSAGDEDEPGATKENAAKYNGNLMKLVGEKKGTPMRPGIALRVYVFALFNENLKPGPASERNYGLFEPDGTPVYDLGVKVLPENSSDSNAGGGHGGGGHGGGGGDGCGGEGAGGCGENGGENGGGSPGYYDISSAAAMVCFLVGILLFMFNLECW